MRQWRMKVFHKKTRNIGFLYVPAWDERGATRKARDAGYGILPGTIQLAGYGKVGAHLVLQGA